MLQVSVAGPALGGCLGDQCVVLPAFATAGQSAAREQELLLSCSGLPGQLPHIRPCTGEQYLHVQHVNLTMHIVFHY